jgi:hypothetical protein
MYFLSPGVHTRKWTLRSSQRHRSSWPKIRRTPALSPAKMHVAQNDARTQTQITRRKRYMTVCSHGPIQHDDRSNDNVCHRNGAQSLSPGQKHEQLCRKYSAQSSDQESPIAIMELEISHVVGFSMPEIQYATKC